MDRNNSCAVFKQYSRELLTPLLLSLSLCACATADPTAGTRVAVPVPVVGTSDVKVYFQGKCPRWVDHWTLNMPKGGNSKVRWVAYDLSGTSTLEVAYDIYFDPFTGPGISAKKGVATSTPIKKRFPEDVSFKYTIVGEGCDVPLDPRIVVRN